MSYNREKRYIEKYSRTKQGKEENVSGHYKNVRVKPELSKEEIEKIKSGKAKKLITEKKKFQLGLRGYDPIYNKIHNYDKKIIVNVEELDSNYDYEILYVLRGLGRKPLFRWVPVNVDSDTWESVNLGYSLDTEKWVDLSPYRFQDTSGYHGYKKFSRENGLFVFLNENLGYIPHNTYYKVRRVEIDKDDPDYDRKEYTLDWLKQEIDEHQEWNKGYQQREYDSKTLQKSKEELETRREAELLKKTKDEEWRKEYKEHIQHRLKWAEIDHVPDWFYKSDYKNDVIDFKIEYGRFPRNKERIMMAVNSREEFFSINDLAKATGIDRKNIGRYLKELEKEDKLTIETAATNKSTKEILSVKRVRDREETRKMFRKITE